MGHKWEESRFRVVVETLVEGLSSSYRAKDLCRFVTRSSAEVLFSLSFSFI